jgi:hypothetical protein
MQYIGSFNFVLKTDFPTYPSTLPYYNVTGEDEQEIGYPKTGFGPDGPPSDKEAMLIAQNYLEAQDLLPDDAILENTQLQTVKTINGSTGKITKKDPIQYSVSYSRIINGYPVEGPGDTLWVDIAFDNELLDNEVVFCFKRWRNLTQSGEIEIINPEEAYEKLLDKKIINKPMQIEPFEINNVSLGYYSSAETQEFYKPVWIFYGPPESSKYYAVEAFQ